MNWNQEVERGTAFAIIPLEKLRLVLELGLLPMDRLKGVDAPVIPLYTDLDSARSAVETMRNTIDLINPMVILRVFAIGLPLSTIMGSDQTTFLYSSTTIPANRPKLIPLQGRDSHTD